MLVFVLLTVITVCSVRHYLSLLKVYWTVGTIIIGSAAIILPFFTRSALGDTSLQAFPAMEVQQRMVDYLERKNLYQKNITAPGFLQREQLLHPLTGMRRTKDTFIHVNSILTDSTELICLDNIEPDSIKTRIVIDHSQYSEVFSVARGDIKGAIYQKH
ncbi:MAG: hypothetical protein EBZ77_06715 [Chitinophagia bacterium]|nr:hypothetical protein [Chitinophagia bacterium]